MIYAQIDNNNILIGWYTEGKPQVDINNSRLIELTYEDSIIIKEKQANYFDDTLNKFIFKDIKREEQIKINFRHERNILLNKVDIEINKAEDNGQDTIALRAYRQALRNSTKDWILPESVI